MKWKFRLNPELSGAWSVHNSGDFSKHNSQAELSLSALCNPGLNKTAQSLCVAGNNLVTPVDPSGFASLQLLYRRCISRCTCERCTAFADALQLYCISRCTVVEQHAYHFQQLVAKLDICSISFVLGQVHTVERSTAIYAPCTLPYFQKLRRCRLNHSLAACLFVCLLPSPSLTFQCTSAQGTHNFATICHSDSCSSPPFILQESCEYVVLFWLSIWL